MRCLLLVAACAGLLLAGCGQPVEETAVAEPTGDAVGGQEQQAESVPEGQPAIEPAEELVARQEEQPESEEAKTPIVRALLDAIDDVDDDDVDDDVRDELREILRDADEELSEVLGENSRRLIEEANKRPPVVVIGPAKRPAVEAEGE